MKKNIIILTVGLTGSSVLTALLARAGYWVGDATNKKPTYDTFENSQLVEINRQIFHEAGYDGHYEMEFSKKWLGQIELTASRVNLAPYQAFVSQCNKSAPWIWKDPRLWLTIRFLDKVIDLQNYKFICLTRDQAQTWISTLLMRQIQSYAYCKKYTELVNGSILEFLNDKQADYIELKFEDLVCSPDKTIDRLNTHLGASLTIQDLEAVYHKPLHKKPRGVFDFVHALLIYMKNYRIRYK